MAQSERRPPSEASRGTSLTVVGEKFRVGRKIGEGSFGIIYEGVNMTNNQKVAIKFVWYRIKTQKLAGKNYNNKMQHYQTSTSKKEKKKEGKTKTNNNKNKNKNKKKNNKKSKSSIHQKNKVSYQLPLQIHLQIQHKAKEKKEQTKNTS